jgi:hypothetical protein
MDIRCSTCGEPWDIDSLHDIAAENGTTFDDARKDFRRRGCEALGTSHSDTVAHPGIAVLAELAGDDLDGFAADLEDFGLGFA